MYLMLNIYRGVLLGAAVGDALGMPYETSPPSLKYLRREYAKPPKMHPNAGLKPGSYTDDTQIALLVAELLVSGNFKIENYSRSLKNSYIEQNMRFPDGTVISACRHMMKGNEEEPGCNSTTSGCIPLSVPFALACNTEREMTDIIRRTCSVTHTNQAAIAGTIWLATLIRSAMKGDINPMKKAQKTAYLEDETLGIKIGEAIRYAEENMPMESAILRIGNDVSVYQTVPLASYMISRFGDDDNILYYAAQAGGNSDTIAFICGSWVGAEFGVSGLPEDLVVSLENRESIESMADRLYYRFSKKD